MDDAELIGRIKTLAEPIHPKRFDHVTQRTSLGEIKCVALDFYGTMFISGVGDIGVDEQQSASKRYFKESLDSCGFSFSNDAVGETGVEQFKKIIDRHIDQKKEDGVAYPEPDIIDVWQEVLATLVQLNFIEGPITEGHAIRFAVEFEFRANRIWPVPELDIILTKLLDHGIKLGIISNSQFYTPLAFHALMGQSTDEFGFDPDLQKWSYVAGNKKPSLKFYRAFTAELPKKGIKPREVLYVGNDLFKDIIPARQLNMKTALYVGDRRSLRHEQADLSKPNHQPDLIIDDLHQIIDCLQ